MFVIRETNQRNKNMNTNSLRATTSTKSKLSLEDNEEEEIWRKFQAREEEIERKKTTVKEKVQQRLGFVEEATRSLSQTLEVSPLCYSHHYITYTLTMHMNVVSSFNENFIYHYQSQRS